MKLLRHDRLLLNGHVSTAFLFIVSLNAAFVMVPFHRSAFLLLLVSNL